MYKIVFLDKLTVGEVPELEKLALLGDYTAYDTTPSDRTAERIGKAEIVITNKVLITKAVMEACPGLKLICIAATGTNNVDLPEAAARGIAVRNVAGYSTDSVTQVTFALLLELLCRTCSYNRYVQEGGYAASPIFTHLTPPFSELAGKTFGIAGLGTIGKSVAKVATAFGAEVVYYSTSGKNDNPEYRQVDFETLLRDSDVISVHAPLNDRTVNLFDGKAFERMKPSAIILNVGRGGIISEAALAKAIDDGRIAGAGIDVFTQEPIRSDNPLLHTRHPERLLLTPHIAWASEEARSRLVNRIVENVQAWISEQP